MNRLGAFVVATQLLRLMDTYHEQVASKRGLGTPGGLEHMGDVWKLFLEWEKELRLSGGDGHRKPYEMKDLGYKRTPTAAKYHTTMEDGSIWAVPVQVIVDSRDEHYKEDKEDTIGSIHDGGLDRYEIGDWAGNNMNWFEVQEWATQVSVAPRKVNWEEGWTNGEHEIVGAL